MAAETNKAKRLFCSLWLLISGTTGSKALGTLDKGHSSACFSPIR